MTGAALRRHPGVVDALVVAAVFTYNLPIQFASVPGHLWPGTGLLLSVGLCAPYLFRRRCPLSVFAVIQGVAALQVVLGVELLVADVILLPALYTVATRVRWIVSAPAAALVVAWFLSAVVPTMRREHLSIGDVGVVVGIIVWAWTWGRLVQVRRRYIASLRERAAQLEREKAALATIAAAEERARIARDLHDVVSHGLSVVVVMSDAAATTVESDPARAKDAMLTVRDTGRSALADMRRMLGVLREREPGSHAPQPGIAQLDRLVDESAAAGLPVRFSQEGPAEPVPASVDLAAYRIVQEALTNVRKHAGPRVTRVEVRVRHRPGELEVSVTDDGDGPPQDAETGGGHGLVGMRERIAAHGGSLRAGPRPGGGFEVVAVLPTGGES